MTGPSVLYFGNQNMVTVAKLGVETFDALVVQSWNPHLCSLALGNELTVKMSFLCRVSGLRLRKWSKELCYCPNAKKRYQMICFQHLIRTLSFFGGFPGTHNWKMTPK